MIGPEAAAGTPSSGLSAPGAIDWVQHWRHLVEARVAQAARLRRPSLPEATDFWGSMAPRFLDMAQAMPASDPLLAAVRDLLSPDQTLLDVGAGAGRYTVALARHVSGVVAVEPSPGMRDALQAMIVKMALPNVTVVPSSWEDADVEPAGVVLAAHVIYRTADIVPFVRKLLAHTRERCLVAQRATQRFASFAPLWEDIWGEPPAPEPGFLDFYNLLFQLGVSADAHLFEAWGQNWASLDEAADAVAHYLLLPPDSEHRARIRRFLEQTLIVREGHWAQPLPTRTAIVSLPPSSDRARGAQAPPAPTA